MEEILCYYGCGQKALFTTKGGRHICANSSNKCPSIRIKNSEAINEKRKNGWSPKIDETKKYLCNWRLNKTDDEIKNIQSRINNSYAKTLKEKDIVGFKGKHHSDETKLKIAISTNNRSKGSFGKQGFYKGIRCDSSWELAYVIYNIDHAVEFKRNEEFFEYYDLNGKKHIYFPDFKLNDGTYVEIKGYMHENAKHKLNEFSKSHKLMILGLDEIKPYLKYAKHKYGKDFIKVYEPL